MKNEHIINFNADEIEEKIGYNFRNKTLLLQAFTRSSCLADGITMFDNEKLEHIGDAMLGLVVTKKLVTRYASTDFENTNLPFDSILDEQQMSEIKMDIVRSSSLAEATENHGLENHILMGKSDVKGNVQNAESVKEDLLEAIIGAVTLDTGWNISVNERVIERLIGLENILEFGRKDAPDYVKELTEYLAARGEKPIFAVESPICKHLDYAVSVSIGAGVMHYEACGYGTTLDGAKRMAAKDALEYAKKTKDMTALIINTVGVPTLENAINQLQELNQKNIIPKPNYEFEECKEKENGNNKWLCSCTLEGVIADKGGYVCATKMEAKKLIAFDVLNRLMGRDLSKLFTENGKLCEDN